MMMKNLLFDSPMQILEYVTHAILFVQKKCTYVLHVKKHSAIFLWKDFTLALFYNDFLKLRNIKRKLLLLSASNVSSFVSTSLPSITMG